MLRKYGIIKKKKPFPIVVDLCALKIISSTFYIYSYSMILELRKVIHAELIFPMK